MRQVPCRAWYHTAINGLFLLEVSIQERAIYGYVILCSMRHLPHYYGPKTMSNNDDHTRQTVFYLFATLNSNLSPDPNSPFLSQLPFFLFPFLQSCRRLLPLSLPPCRSACSAQGYTKISFPDCVKLDETVAFCLPTAGRRMQCCHPIFKQPGKALLVQPCSVAPARSLLLCGFVLIWMEMKREGLSAPSLRHHLLHCSDLNPFLEVTFWMRKFLL